MSDRPEPRFDDAVDGQADAREEQTLPRPPFSDSAVSTWTGRLAIVALFALIATALVVEFQRERVRWRAAGAYRTFLTAYERDETGKVDETRRRERILQATEELRSSVGVGAEPRWKAVEASWLLEAGETSAARVLLDDLVARHPDWLAVRVDRMTAACNAQDAETVVADCDWLEEAYGDEMFASMSDPTSGVSHAIPIPNLRAYMLAVVGRNLDEAEREIDRVLEELSSADSYGNASLLDTKGFVLYRQGDYREATKLLDEAVKLLDEPARRPGEPLSDLDLVRTYRRIAAREASQDRPHDVADLEESRAFYERAQSLAVMLYHRALAFEARGWKEEAEADRRVIAELGFEANDSLF
jgi:tetratricopeptide (TPR) repeat protein